MGGDLLKTKAGFGDKNDLGGVQGDEVAPPQGLCLTGVRYPADPFSRSDP